MKKVENVLPLPRIILACRCLPVFFLLMLVLPTPSTASADANRGFPDQSQAKINSGGQVEVRAISEEEYKTFDSAKQEIDPKKRAAKLFDFIQKYPKSPLVEQISLADRSNIKIIEDEYSAYFAAQQAPDLGNRAEMLIQFLQKYPQSPLSGNVNYDYAAMLKKASQAKDYTLLESLAEKWLKIHPNDTESHAFLADAALNLQHYEKCGQSLEAIYAVKPSADLAGQVYGCYEKGNNPAKETEWAAKLFTMPEFDKDYMLRYGYVLRFSKENNLPKAAEYAQLTLKSTSLVNPSDGDIREQLRQVQRACFHVIGSSQLEKGNFSEAITSFEKALKIERYEQGYYSIGLCLDNQKDVEKALHYYAAAELMGGEDAAKAKSRLEALYKALHNDTLIGIDKVYQRGKELLAGSNNLS